MNRKIMKTIVTMMTGAVLCGTGLAQDLKPGCKEVTTKREVGYDIGVVHDKVTVTEREVVCKEKADKPAKESREKADKPTREGGRAK